MKRNSLYKGLAVSVVLSAVLTGCGSSSVSDGTIDDGSNTTGDTQQTAINGKAIDGYLQNAVVCLDLNNDGYCQANSEPLTTTLADGSFTLNITKEHRNSENFDEAMLLIFGGVDVDTGKDFTGKLMAPNDGSALLNVSPITTIVAKNVQKSLKAEKGLTKEQIKEKIKEARRKVADVLEISEEEIGLDPVERKNKGDDKLIRKSLQIQKSLEAQLIAAQTANKDLREKIDALYEALADGLDDMADGEKGLDKLYEKAAQKELYKETLRGHSTEQMLDIADQISKNLDDAFDKIEDDDLEKIAAITRDDFRKIEEGAKDGDLSEAIKGIVFLPEDNRFKAEFDWSKAYLEDDLYELGVKPTETLVNKLKALYNDEDIKPGILFHEAKKLKESKDEELNALYTKILRFKEKVEKEKEQEEAKYSDEIIKVETPMSIYNISHDMGYERVTFTAENRLTFQEYRFDMQSGTFVEDSEDDQGKNYMLVNGEWKVESDDVAISIDEKGVISLPSFGQKAVLTSEKDLSDDDFFLPYLKDEVKMPKGAKGYMVRIEQVEDTFELNQKEQKYSSISEFITGQCGDRWFDGDERGGISFSGVLGENGQYVCDPTKTEGELSEVMTTFDGQESIKPNAGKWKIVTLPNTDQKALVVESYNRYDDEDHGKLFFTEFDDGSGKALYRGEIQEKGTTFAFPSMNKVAMDTLITSTINAFENKTFEQSFFGDKRERDFDQKEDSEDKYYEEVDSSEELYTEEENYSDNESSDSLFQVKL